MDFHISQGHWYGSVEGRAAREVETVRAVRIIVSRPLHSPRITVWCAVSRLGVVGPFFFEEGGETVTVTSNRYCEMLENFLRSRMDEFDGSEDFWFQQDGATAHTARRSREF